MRSNYLFGKTENYMTLVISGEYDKDDFLSYPQLILDECEKEKLYKILVDGSNLTGTNLPTMDRYFIGETIAKMLGGKVKLAVVWPKKHINKFAETVAVNRGSSIIVVDTIGTAHEWLLGEV